MILEYLMYWYGKYVAPDPSTSTHAVTGIISNEPARGIVSSEPERGIRI